MKGLLKTVLFFSLIHLFTLTATSKTLTDLGVAVFATSVGLPDSSIVVYQEGVADNNNLLIKLQLKTSENKRLTAFFLAVALGHFGVHRLYLGTKPIVPISYVLTLGGGLGVLPAIDAIVILFSKDLEKLGNNSKFFMWSE